MSRRVAVHHFVVADYVRPHGPTWRTSDLLGVSHWREVPPDTEFPRTVARMQIFARFYLSRARPTEFRVRVWWLDHPSGEPELIGDYGPYLVPFTPDVTARDYSFNLHNIQLQGMGLGPAIHQVSELLGTTR